MSILTRGPGPGIIVKVSPLRVRRGECSQVLMRSMRGDSSHGRWEPVSRDGFVVVCPSRLEACELILLVGGRFFTQPPALVRGDDHDDDRFLDWLLEHHFRIDPLHESDVGPFRGDGVSTKRAQVMFSTFLRGWRPGSEDMQETIMSGLIEPLVRSRWRSR